MDLLKLPGIWHRLSQNNYNKELRTPESSEKSVRIFRILSKAWDVAEVY
jgi:hypothetical protein